MADLLKPVATQIAADVLRSKWVQSDDTGVDVQDRTANPQIRTGHVWTYRGSDASAFYDFTWMRNSEGPLRVLAHFRGYLQADAAPAFDDVYRTLPIIEVGCWAHARRRFKEAMRTSPKEGGAGGGVDRGAVRARAQREEEQARRRAAPALRQQSARPILKRIHAYLQEIAVHGPAEEPAGRRDRLRATAVGRAEPLHR